VLKYRIQRKRILARCVCFWVVRSCSTNRQDLIYLRVYLTCSPIFFLSYFSFCYNRITKLIVNPTNAAILVNFYVILTIGECVNKLLPKHTQLLCCISILFFLFLSLLFFVAVLLFSSSFPCLSFPVLLVLAHSI
jgi:hypothetical protein